MCCRAETWGRTRAGRAEQRAMKLHLWSCLGGQRHSRRGLVFGAHGRIRAHGPSRACRCRPLCIAAAERTTPPPAPPSAYVRFCPRMTNIFKTHLWHHLLCTDMTSRLCHKNPESLGLALSNRLTAVWSTRAVCLCEGGLLWAAHICP